MRNIASLLMLCTPTDRKYRTDYAKHDLYEIIKIKSLLKNLKKKKSNEFYGSSERLLSLHGPLLLFRNLKPREISWLYNVN